MGVYIANMSKPKGCVKEIDDGLLDEACMFLEYDLSCKLQPESNGYDYVETYKTCPLIEIDLVRCGECMHYDDGLCHRPKWAFVVEETGFCNYGERRTDDNK